MENIVSKIDEIFFTLLDDHFWYVSDRKSLLRLVGRHEIISLSAVQSHLTITLSIYLDIPHSPHEFSFDKRATSYLRDWGNLYLDGFVRSSAIHSRSYFKTGPFRRLADAVKNRLASCLCRIYRDASEETGRSRKSACRKKSKMLKIVGPCRSARNTKAARHGPPSRTGSIASTAACHQRK